MTINQPHPNRDNDNLCEDIGTTYDSNHITISVEQLDGLNVSIMRNGWPNWGLRNSDLNTLYGISEDKDYINLVFSMLSPYVFINSYITGSESDSYSNEQLDEFDFMTEYISPFESRLFTNDDLVDSLLDTIPKDEVGFLSFGRNKMSIKGLTVSLQEQTGLYSYKRFKFQFVVHRPDAFSEEFIQSIFSPENKFMIRWGYDINISNSDLLYRSREILNILGAENKEIIQFTTWSVKQESNDHNIEISAEAIPAPNKSFVTVKMGEHILQSSDVDVLRSYEETVSGINSSENNNRENDKLRQNIQNKINEIIVSAFTTSINRIRQSDNKVLLSDILNEISSCVNYSLLKNGNKSSFKFACGKFNDTIQPNDDYIGNFAISQEEFKKFNTKITKSKNIPHPLSYLDQFIAEFMDDYISFKNVSNTVNDIINEKQQQENVLRKKPQESQKIIDASNVLKEIDLKLSKLSIPSIKFFNHEHIDEFNHVNYYCFVIDSSYGVPKIYNDNNTDAFQKVVESNVGISQETIDDLTIPGSIQEQQQRNNGIFDIPIFNLFSENTILKDMSLDSETDEELQASIIKRMADKNLRGDDGTNGISFNDQFKFLTTKISFKTIGNNAFITYQPIFFRNYGNVGVFSRLYNITEIEHVFSPGEWITQYNTVMNAI